MEGAPQLTSNTPANDSSSGQANGTTPEEDQAAEEGTSAGFLGAAAENDSDEEASPTSSIQLGMGKPVRKYAFKFKKSNNGNILTIHHTVQDGNQLIRIRMAACCFSEHCTLMVAIDRRGNIFVFDLANKRYWQLIEVILRASVIAPWVQHNNLFLVGTKLGQLVLLDLAQSAVTKALAVSSDPIKAISFPGQPLQPQHLVLVQAGCEAILINLKKFCFPDQQVFFEVSKVKSKRFTKMKLQQKLLKRCFYSSEQIAADFCSQPLAQRRSTHQELELFLGI